MNGLKSLFCFLVVLLLVGCATSKPSHYYTLMPTAQGLSDTGAPGVGVDSPPEGAKFAISVGQVELPEQVERPQIVITDPDSTQVMPLGDSLWAAPLSDEITQALSDQLTRRLGVLDVATMGIPDGFPVWMIQLRVQRFESVYNQRAVLDATWRLTPVNQKSRRASICRGDIQVPVQPGMSALIAGHQQALQALAAVMAEQIRTGDRPSGNSPVNLKGCTFL